MSYIRRNERWFRRNSWWQHRPFQYQLSPILKSAGKENNSWRDAAFSFHDYILWTHHYSLTHHDWKIFIWNFYFTAHGSGKQKVETFAPTCNGRTSIQGVVTVLVSSWDGNHARSILKGKPVGSWCDFQHELSNKIAECYNSLFSRW